MDGIFLENVSKDDLTHIIRAAIAEKLDRVILDQPKPKKGKYLTRKEAAEKLRISLTTLYNLTKTGKLRGLRVGGRVVYHSDELEASLIEIPTIQ